MLTAALALVPAAVYHRVLRWLGIQVDDFHVWVGGHCPCGAFGDDEDDAA